MENPWLIGPTHVDFNVTNGCNLACSHCHSSSGDKLPAELTTDEVHHLLDQLNQMGVLRLAIAGGEPFMRRDIFDILEYACALPGWQVSVITNGLFFRNGDRVIELAGRCPDLTVNVSLDGSDPARFHVLRKQVHRPDEDPTPMFTQVRKAIEDLVSSGINTAVNFTVSTPTLDDLLPTYHLAVEELGAAALIGIKFFPGGYGKALRDLLELPFPVWSRTFAELTRSKLEGALPHLRISVPAAWEFYLPLIQAGLDVVQSEAVWGYSAPLREDGFSKMYSIGDVAGIADMAIAGDGKVYPTVLLIGVDDTACGDTRHSSLADIWASAPILTRMRTMTVADLAANCGECGISYICGGGSRARAYANTGDLSSADYACPIIRRDRPRPGTRPHQVIAPKKSAVQVFGKGRSAVRIFFTDDGCQVRVNNHIVMCNEPNSRLLQMALRGGRPENSGGPGPAETDPAERALGELTSTLLRLGVPGDSVAALSAGPREGSISGTAI